MSLRRWTYRTDKCLELTAVLFTGCFQIPPKKKSCGINDVGMPEGGNSVGHKGCERQIEREREGERESSHCGWEQHLPQDMEGLWELSKADGEAEKQPYLWSRTMAKLVMLRMWSECRVSSVVLCCLCEDGMWTDCRFRQNIVLRAVESMNSG